MTAASASLDRFVPVAEAMRVAGVESRVTLWRWENECLFPKRHKIGPRRVGYLESELRAWVEQQSAA